MWTTSYLHPVIDSSQDLKKREGYFEDGITTLKFSRKRDTGDARNDVAFTGEKGLFFIFPVKGGRYNAASGKIKKHEQTPTASAQRIFIKPCRNCKWRTCKNTFQNDIFLFALLQPTARPHSRRHRSPPR